MRGGLFCKAKLTLLIYLTETHGSVLSKIGRAIAAVEAYAVSFQLIALFRNSDAPSGVVYTTKSRGEIAGNFKIVINQKDAAKCKNLKPACAIFLIATHATSRVSSPII